MTGSLDRLASLLTGRPGTTATEIPWHLLRPEHTTAIRAQLLAAYAPSTSRKMLSALAGALYGIVQRRAAAAGARAAGLIHVPYVVPVRDNG